MATACPERPVKSDLWQEYRFAFTEFFQKLRRLQVLASQANANPEALLRASLEVEEARIAYDCQRDLVVQELLPRVRYPAKRWALR